MIDNDFNLGDLVIVRESFEDSLPPHTRVNPDGGVIAWEVISIHYNYEGLSYGLAVDDTQAELFEDVLIGLA